MNELVKGLSQNDVVTYPHAFFKWVYANPCPSLVGIRRIPAYHVDYTTACKDSPIYSSTSNIWELKTLMDQTEGSPMLKNRRQSILQ